MNRPAEKVDPPSAIAGDPPGTDELVRLVDRLVHESGDPRGFDAGNWVHQWIHAYVPALGNTPASFMGTPEGRDLIKNVLETSQSGVYL